MSAVARVLRRWRGVASAGLPGDKGVSERAGCAFGLVTRRAVEDLEGSFRRLEGKIDGLLFAVALAILLDVWRALGAGWP